MVNWITQPRSQQHACRKLKSEHWGPGETLGFPDKSKVSGFSSSNPVVFSFLFWVRSKYRYVTDMLLLVSVIPAVAKPKLNRQGCSMSAGAYGHPLTPSIYTHVSKTLAVLEVFGLDDHASSIVEVFHPLGTFWAMTIEKKFHAVSPIVLQPHSFFEPESSPSVAVSLNSGQLLPQNSLATILYDLERSGRVIAIHSYQNSAMKKLYCWCWWKVCKIYSKFL